jgi:hypothetical protein
MEPFHVTHKNEKYGPQFKECMCNNWKKHWPVPKGGDIMTPAYNRKAVKDKFKKTATYLESKYTVFKSGILEQPK